MMNKKMSKAEVRRAWENARNAEKYAKEQYEYHRMEYIAARALDDQQRMLEMREKGENWRLKWIAFKEKSDAWQFLLGSM